MGKPALVGSAAVKPAGIATNYTIEVTDAVGAVLARPAGQRKLRLEVRMLGLPSYYEVYGLATGQDAAKTTLEIAPATNVVRDWDKRLVPITQGDTIYREACMPIVADPTQPYALKLLETAKRVIEVIHNGTGETLKEGQDWFLKDGVVYLPPGSRAPMQKEIEFFARTPQKPLPLNSVVLKEGTFYHERQLEVTYEPAQRTWQFPPAVSSLDDFPRLKKRLAEKAPVSIVLFGDSILTGGNASRYHGCWPYQPAFGELAAWKLQSTTGSPVTVVNHSRGGATSDFGTTQVESQVGWFKPDLAIVAYGMNDRSDERRPRHKANLEAIIDAIRKHSPGTEIVLVTSMMNNPKQPAGSAPILAIRDEALKIQRPGVARVDVTTTHQELLKRKNYLDTSGNGANHPNDFLHRIYAQRLCEVLLPK